MALKTLKPGFVTGIHYLDYLQNVGQCLGGVQLINRRFEFGKSLYSKDLFAHFGCVNAVEFSNDGEWLASGGDDKRVLLWNVDKTLSFTCQPKSMKGEHNSNIFCLGFNASRTKLFSAGNDEQVILHDVSTADISDVFLHDEAVYSLSVNPLDDNLFLSACDDGRVLSWDVRLSSGDPSVLASCLSPYHAVMYNPVEPHYVATGSAKEGVCLWDTRRPRAIVMKYEISKGAMSVRFNRTGTHLLALRRRLPPVLYDVTCGICVAEFDHPEYYNSCTMKSCCFAGDRDQYVLSGSDDFKLYVWNIPGNLADKRVWVEKAHFVLRGHRSIVNQVRYNHSYGILASSGVEKIVKIWSSFKLSSNDALDDYVSEKDVKRKVYTHEEYINLVLESGQFMTHDYSHHSVQEDPRMMAFFDSLVQRDIEGFTSDSGDSTASSVDANGCLDSTSSSTLESDTESLCKYFLAKEEDPSVDRISRLIIKKRKEAKLKVAQGNLCAFKRKKMRKHAVKKTTKKANEIQDCEKSLSDFMGNDPQSSQNLSDKSSVSKDKRRILRMKRAKLSKNTYLDESSSDSDLSNENSNSQLQDKEEIDQSSQDFKTNDNLPCKDEEKRFAGDLENRNVISNDPLVYFTPKNGNYANRNYRKRSAEDKDDD